MLSQGGDTPKKDKVENHQPPTPKYASHEPWPPRQLWSANVGPTVESPHLDKKSNENTVLQTREHAGANYEHEKSNIVTWNTLSWLVNVTDCVLESCYFKVWHL